jgi:protocatechuate 3,4-dioxygenase beta subunit
MTDHRTPPLPPAPARTIRPGAADSHAHPSRRQVLAAGLSALALGAARLRVPSAAGAQDPASPATDVCVLTPEQTAGPFYLPLELIRRDITEDRPGAPLRLRIAVADVNACAPLANAAVDIWHCDAQGYYSGVAGDPGGNANPEAGAGAASGTFLRGVQLTGEDGIAEFDTIYPGWYSGRAVHIHMVVYAGGTPEMLEPATPAGRDAGSYEGGHLSHTGQLYFDDALSDQIFDSAEAYAGRDNARRVRNEQDGILGGQIDEPGFVLGISMLGEGFADGLLGEITIGVDPSAAP